jgi:nicotinamide phosphoribosyltransferase
MSFFSFNANTLMTFAIVATTVFTTAIAFGHKQKKKESKTLWVNPGKPFFNLCLTDSYKGDHSEMLDTVKDGNIQNVQCYFSPRLGSKGDGDSVIFVGLQPILETIKNTRITKEEVDRVEALFKRGYGLGSFNRKPWDLVVEKFDGILPIEIFALEEGLNVPRGVPLFKIQSTCPEFASAIGYLEPFLSHVWYSTTVASKCFELKRILNAYAEKTGTNPEHTRFQFHDFGVRGASSMQTAGQGGVAHLAVFRGTDNLPAIDYVDTFYGMENDGETPGCSVNATEHSVMTANGKDGEEAAVMKLLKKYPEGLLSIVIDSFNQERFVEMITSSPFIDIILKRKGKVVLRPDSGEPKNVLRMILDIVEKNLGPHFSVNAQGFKEFPPQIGIIYGDGVNGTKVKDLLDLMVEKKFSVGNIVFGAGGALLQKGLYDDGMNRDTYRCSFKLCAIQDLSGIWRSVFKDPSDGKSVKGESKASLAGRQKVIFSEKENRLVTVCEDNISYTHCSDQMRLVFRNGELFNRMSFDAVRRNVLKSEKDEQLL